MRESQTKKIPVTIILGDKERDNNQISFRRFQSKETTTKDKEDFINEITKEIKEKIYRPSNN